ncbi:GNAT family N-acetyltransferase [Actinocorallia longicatena]|uniref:N-acetyltransferase domain-containing protein n=1 Tax=Actinocorallia longicatena TaxID=111803 RepID=A0ABP6QFS9_9ACTN
MPISLRRVEPADFPQLRTWLEQPHVARWWNHETSPEAVERDFGPATRGEEPCEDFIALLDGAPVGLVQRSRFADYPGERDALAKIVEVPVEAMTVDYLIGDLDRTGRGLGPRIIEETLARTWRDHPAATCVIVAIAAGNRPSWRALEKAGLHRVGEGDLEPDNPVDEPLHYVYRIDRPL